MRLLEMTVDVVIPTHFETERLFRAIESVLGQTVAVQKLIIVDDGSSDEVRKQISFRYSKNARVELIFSDHLGHPGRVRNLGVQACTSNWIALLDADDYWGPKKLERQLEIAEASNADLVYTNSINVYEESSRSGIQSKNLPRRLSTWGLILCNHLVNSSVLVKRSALNSVGNFVESDIVLGVEDYATWLRVSLAGKLVGLDEPLVHYTISAASLSRRKNGRTRLDAIENFIDWIHSQVPHSPLSIVIEVFARIVALRESVPRRVRGLFHGVS